MFRVELEHLVDQQHPLVRLGQKINWSIFDESLGASYHPTQGAPGINTRLMVSLHYLKYQHDLSDAAVVEVWVENPYWQHFSGEQFFQHEMPIDASSMTRWRKRLGASGAEQLLRETIETGIRMKAIKPSQMKRINVDTTVQEKAIRYPTDARSYNRMRERLVKAARGAGLRVKQSYERVGPRLLMESGRYAHARQMKRSRASTRKLRTCLGRVMREIERQKVEEGSELAQLLQTAQRIHAQKPQDKHKVYSVHEPQVECISKGKSGKKYEFGNKVSVAVSSVGGWVLGSLSLEGNPYDGHTLAAQMQQVHRLIGDGKVSEVHVDMGYRKHGYDGAETIHVDKRSRGRTPKRLWRWMKRRAAVEPTIGHLKSEHRLDRNRLKGTTGDAINAMLSAAGMNLQKLLGAFLRFLLGQLLERDNALLAGN